MSLQTAEQSPDHPTSYHFNKRTDTCGKGTASAVPSKLLKKMRDSAPEGLVLSTKASPLLGRHLKRNASVQICFLGRIHVQIR